MSRLAYLVSSEPTSWRIRHAGHAAGDFASRDDALQAAIRLAKEAESLGHQTAVMLSDENGAREVWPQRRAD